MIRSDDRIRYGIDLALLTAHLLVKQIFSNCFNLISISKTTFSTKLTHKIISILQKLFFLFLFLFFYFQTTNFIFIFI